MEYHSDFFGLSSTCWLLVVLIELFSANYRVVHHS